MTTTNGIIRLVLKSFNRKLLDSALTKILGLINTTGPGSTTGPVKLPCQIKKFSVLRSPHIDKDSRDQLEIRTHKRLIDIGPLRAKILELLMRVELPAEVVIEVKT